MGWERQTSMQKGGLTTASPVEKSGKIWSGIRESNPRLDLGKVAYYHYTNPAHGKLAGEEYL